MCWTLIRVFLLAHCLNKSCPLWYNFPNFWICLKYTFRMISKSAACIHFSLLRCKNHFADWISRFICVNGLGSRARDHAGYKTPEMRPRAAGAAGLISKKNIYKWRVCKSEAVAAGIWQTARRRLSSIQTQTHWRSNVYVTNWNPLCLRPLRPVHMGHGLLISVWS